MVVDVAARLDFWGGPVVTNGLWLVPVFLAVLCLVILGLGRLLLSGGKSGPPLRPGWMCGVVGLRGHGKSLFVARLIAQRLSAGVNVVANFPIAGGTVRMTSWDHCILAPERSMVVLDEAHQWARARAGVSLDPLADWYVSHSRKLGHEVWWIAQDETQVASGVRVQTNEYVECKKLTRTWHRACSYSPREFRKSKAKPLWAWRYTPKGPAIEVYDTFELVRPVEREVMTRAESVAHLNGMIDEIYRRRGLILDPVVVSPQVDDPDSSATKEPRRPGVSAVRRSGSLPTC